MNRWRCFPLALLILVTSSLAAAEEVLLVKTRNDINERDDRLYLELDEEGTPIELVHRVYDLVMGVYRAEDLVKGVVLRSYKGKPVLKLQMTGFDPDHGGKATLSYLTRLVPTSQYKSLKFDLQRRAGRWSLYQLGDDRRVKLLFFQARFSTVLGVQRPVGIQQIRVLRDRR